MTTSLVRPFAVISGAQVHRALDGREKQIVELVQATYRLHAAGETVNPPWPHRPRRTYPATAEGRWCQVRGSSVDPGPPESHRANAVHGNDLRPRMPLPEVAHAAHRGPSGACANEHIHPWELARDRRCRRAVVRLPVSRIDVLVEPHVPVVGGAQRPHLVERCARKPSTGSSSAMTRIWLPNATISRRVARLHRESRTGTGSPCSPRAC